VSSFHIEDDIFPELFENMLMEPANEIGPTSKFSEEFPIIGKYLVSEFPQISRLSGYGPTSVQV